MKTNPILEEIRAVRDKDAALVRNDVHRLFMILRAETETIQKQGRALVRPLKAAGTSRVVLRERPPKNSN